MVTTLSHQTPLLVVCDEKVGQLAALLQNAGVPSEQEAAEHSFVWGKGDNLLANSYLAVVAICHQTSPIGERPLLGQIDGRERRGWDFLKERFLLEVTRDEQVAEPARWSQISPYQLSSLFEDQKYGRTLNRINERCFLLNDLGRHLASRNYRWVSEGFLACGETLGGERGFIAFLKGSEAYSDPLAKKAFFFVAIAKNECNWKIRDPHNLLSPVDYHELRGHLRLGTILVVDRALDQKLRCSLPVTVTEDLVLREAVQKANGFISKSSGVSNGALHYVLWNVFRSCCTRSSSDAHCSACAETCALPQRYKQMPIFTKRCLFAGVCASSKQSEKYGEPVYFGHYY